MDQNTNKSFTSAPQGGDFSDIIIPNAYATKPKGKNLKKYVVFGVIGLVVVFLIGLITKAIFVDSRTMSKQEFVQFAESADMGNIEWIENFFITVNNGALSFDQFFSYQQYTSMQEAGASLRRVKELTSKKSKIGGSKKAQALYEKFAESLKNRLDIYEKGIQIYLDAFQAYNKDDFTQLEKTSSEILDYTVVSNKLGDISKQTKEFKQIAKNENCNFDFAANSDSILCSKNRQKLKDLKTMAENDEVEKKILNIIYSNFEDYSKIDVLSKYIDDCLVYIR